MTVPDAVPAGARAARAVPDALARVLLVVLLVLPWLWPWTSGPSAGVQPLLAAWACLLLALPLWAFRDDPAATAREVLPLSWGIAALVSAAIGLAQWFGVAPDTALVNAADLGEAYGNLRQRNQFATLMGLGLLAVVWAPRRLPWPAAVAAVVLLALANAASASRTGLLQWLAIGALALAWPGQRRQRVTLCVVALAAYVAAGWLLPAVLWHWRGIEAASVFHRAVADLGCSSRKVLWANVLQLVAQRPWLGWGPGELDYAHYATLYPGERFCDILDNAHNLPLHLAVELGVPAALAACGALALAVWRGRPWREADASRQLAWAVLLAIGLHSLLEYPLWYGPFQLAALGAAVLLLARGPIVAPARAGVAAVALAGLALLAGVGLAYDRVSDAYRPPEQRRPALRTDPVASLAGTPLFRDQLQFAQLAVTPLTRANAAQVHALALQLLHYSPEPLVIERVIDSALLLGREDEAAWHAARFRAAFPQRYAQWMGQSAAPLPARP